MKKKGNSPKTIDEAVEQIQSEFPSDFLEAIGSLSLDELKSYQITMDGHIKNSLVSWLHCNTHISDQCGSYSSEDIIGYFIWHLWKELRVALEEADSVEI